ncbi:MAG: UDP-2,3-diacylglucosamine diphosphatase [Pseudomonadota bacterium]
MAKICTDRKYTVVISDTHFSENYPEITQRFIEFLEYNKTAIETLYLLGDLFDAWIGDDHITPLSQKISDILADCANDGMKIYFMRGNRDYLMGEKFAASCNMTLLDDKTVISLYGKKTLLMHGDLLCTDDRAYQKYRKIMFSPIMKKICLMLPLNFRKKIAEKLRKVSQESNATKSMHIMDVSENSVIQVLEQYHAELLIHGHTHRQANHTVTLMHQSAQRMVLGAWENTQGNAIVASEIEAPRFINFDNATKNLVASTEF